jgi:hypothetical protein
MRPSIPPGVALWAFFGWFFLVSRQIGVGVVVPEAAFMQPTQQSCNEIREAVNNLMELGLVVSECRDGEKWAIRVPIYGGKP